ncbi:XdhC family protein [Marisediminicola senii]|uniref:XdhC family protein n=1 Tax=Marisediminicola senii TaxID=2711233 RepID=UPI0013EC5102|nr:XdhC/CoxI family protein [Marisediminicola senii]
MFEIADRLLAALDSGHRIAVATAVTITGSAPRAVGTSMAVVDDGTVIGSISGGCIEGALYEIGTRVLETGRPEFEGFGFDDESAFAVGLSCGGMIEVIVSVLAMDAASAPTIDQLRRAAAGSAAELTTVIAGDPARLGESVPSPHGCDGLRTFTERFAPASRFIVFGAVEFAVALSDAAAALGYRVTVCDPRPVFATPERFPRAEEVVVQWPPQYLAQTAVDERTVICILSHDDRFDVDLIAGALELPVAYIGAMGSRRTHASRVEELAARGIHDLDRLHAPIGLDIGARTPEETAISILAEVIASRTGAAAEPLTSVSGPIHRAQ